jgi:hypothetical protein
MTRLITSGFEIYVANSLGAGAPDGATANPAVSRVTTGQRSGTGCLRINTSTTAGFNSHFITGVNGRGYWARAYIKIGSPSSQPPTRLLYLSSGNNNQGAMLDGSSQVFHDQAPGTLSPAINDGAWHRIEVYTFFSATQASRAWELRVDGTTISSGTAQIDDAAAPTNLYVGWTDLQSADIYFDDLALNDDQGAAPHNTWPGDGYVICLLPTSDNTRGLWTGGAGGTTNLFDALNNTPPVGAVAPGTNTSQISANAVATTGVFDTQSYLAAGATAGHTAICCAVVACTGEQVATGTKSGSANIDTAVNNSPTATTGSLAYGLDIGAEGAWPTLWRWWASPFTAYASQPTLSSGARLNIVTTTVSRVADCCFLGLLVEMQPAAVTAVIPDVGMALTVT